MKRRRHAPLFPVNVWPPFVDALTLVLAGFVLVVAASAIARSTLIARLSAGEQELQRVRDEKQRIEKRLRSLSVAAGIEIEDGKVIVQGEVLFASGSDELSPEGLATVQRLAPALAQLLQTEPDQMILVGGHTDDVPIANQRFASNWELSAARATAVARALIGAGLSPARVLASGFGSYHPLTGNHGPDERRRNRRIEVLVVPIKAVASR